MSLSLAAAPKAHDGPSVLCLRRQGMRLPTQPMPRRQGIWLPTRPGRGHEGRECGFRPARAEATKAGKAASDRAPTHELGSTRLLPHRGSRAAKGPEGATNHFLKFRDTSPPDPRALKPYPCLNAVRTVCMRCICISNHLSVSQRKLARSCHLLDPKLSTSKHAALQQHFRLRKVTL